LSARRRRIAKRVSVVSQKVLLGYAFYYNDTHRACRAPGEVLPILLRVALDRITLALSFDANREFRPVSLEERTARLTILIDPRKKAVFERLCAQEDLTSSQVIRRMIRSYIETRLGRPWVPGEETPATGADGAGRAASKRRAARG